MSAGNQPVKAAAVKKHRQFTEAARLDYSWKCRCCKCSTCQTGHNYACPTTSRYVLVDTHFYYQNGDFPSAKYAAIQAIAVPFSFLFALLGASLFILVLSYILTAAIILFCFLVALFILVFGITLDYLCSSHGNTMIWSVINVFYSGSMMFMFTMSSAILFFVNSVLNVLMTW